MALMIEHIIEPELLGIGTHFLDGGRSMVLVSSKSSDVGAPNLEGRLPG